MLKRCSLLIFFVFLVTGCLHQKQKTPLLPELNTSTSCVKQVRGLSSFNQINVQGRINMTVHTGYKQPQIILRGDPRDLEQVKTLITYTTLYVLLDKAYPQHAPVHVDVRGRFLNKFRYEGDGAIRGSQIQTRYLDLDINNQGTTELGGHIGLHQVRISGNGSTRITGISSPWMYLHLSGTPKVQLNGLVTLAGLKIDGGWLSLYWIKSDNLKIRAKEGAKIQLAGVVNRLDLELWGNALFEGRYLRAQRSFVKTHDRSLAQIDAINHQSSLAMDASDIYYYNIPDTRADFMAFDGAVLKMREWSPSDFKDFTRYNKQVP